MKPLEISSETNSYDMNKHFPFIIISTRASQHSYEFSLNDDASM